MPEFPMLETERLLLRELADTDVDAMFAVFADPQVTRFYNVPTFERREEAELIVDKRRKRFWSGRGVCWGIARKVDDVLLGTCGFNAWAMRRQVGDLGYELGRPYWNQGIMTEALTAVVAYGFDTLQLSQQRAWVMPNNVASAHVLTKLGFDSQGVQAARGYWSGRFHDLELFMKERDKVKG